MSISENKYNNSKSHLRLIALCGIFAALVFIGTELKIPTAIGSALGDLIAGYPMYIAPTFIIKGLMGLVVAIVISVPLTYAIRIKKQK